MGFDLVDSRNRKRSTGSVRKYIERNKRAITDALKKKIADSGLGDILDGHDVELDVKKGGSSTDEPMIGYSSQEGSSDQVLTGNDQYNRGDQYPMPKGGKGQGGGQDGDDGVDSFKFRMTSKEFLDLVFDSLALPNKLKKVFIEEDSNVMQRSGFTTEGAPSRLSIIRTYRQSLGRTLAEKEQYRIEMEDEEDEDKKEIIEQKIKNISLFRDVDLRYTHWTPAPTIRFKCTIFMIMDVSGSMGEDEKELGKGFFLLFLLFLRKTYNEVEIIFLRHTTVAEEVDEKTFFYDPKNGGTLMSPALVLMDEIIRERIDLNTSNVYVAQVSDGDNTYSDTTTYLEMLKSTILPKVQYFIYIEVAPNRGMGLFNNPTSTTLKGIRDIAVTHDNINAAVVRSVDRIWYVFIELFKTKGFKD